MVEVPNAIVIPDCIDRGMLNVFMAARLFMARQNLGYLARSTLDNKAKRSRKPLSARSTLQIR